MPSDLEVFSATVEHRRPARILYRAQFTPDLERRLKEHIGSDDIAGHFGIMQVGQPWFTKPEGYQAPDFSRYYEHEDLPEGTEINDFGVASVLAGFYHFTGMISPLRNAASLSEIEGFPIEDYSGWGSSHLASDVEAIHAEGKVAIGLGGHMYETAWQIRGYEQFLTDMMDRPTWAECLLERVAARNRIVAEALAAAGVDCVYFGDDVANQKSLMFSPELWRKMMRSRWEPIWRAVKDKNPDCKIWYHSDGNIFEIVGELVDAGVDILNPLQPECLDLDAVHRRYGDRICFDGCIGTQSTMPWGSPDDVRARVKEVIDKYGRNGGLFISPTHVLEPEVPIENIEALFEACREYGTFE